MIDSQIWGGTIKVKVEAVKAAVLNKYFELHSPKLRHKIICPTQCLRSRKVRWPQEIFHPRAKTEELPMASRGSQITGLGDALPHSYLTIQVVDEVDFNFLFCTPDHEMLLLFTDASAERQ